jgi:single-stranded-DNA-specific exonuclease
MKPILSNINKQWNDPPAIELPIELSHSLHLPDLVLRTLYRQGVRTAAEAHAFMDFHLYSPASPYDLPDMEKGIERTIRAIKDKEKIGVWGDFDVDGQTSTAVLVAALRKVNAKMAYHIPIRGPESHGVQLKALKKFIAQGISLVITCDTGISEFESVAWARQHDVDFIITDHHTLPEQLPQAFAVINPQRLEQFHPLYPLPGVGVACKFVEALLEHFNQAEFSRSLYDLAALGIIADIAELHGDARFLTQSGIDLVRTSTRPSIQAMLKAAEINPDQFNEESISYSLAPRMNAMGRLADANPMVDFLLSENATVLSVTVNQLEGLNARRKLLCDQVFQGAMDQIERSPDLLDHPVLMLSHPEWPAGVVGIVASRLVSIYQKPVMLFVAPSGELMRGSARSVEGVNITAKIRREAALLSSFGGHPMAAGLSLDPQNFTQFQRDLDRSVEEELSTHPITRELQIDAWQQPSAVDFDLLQAIDPLAPFGAGNPPLVFAAKEMHLISATPVGKTHEHLQMVLEDAFGKQSKLIWWQGTGLPQPEDCFDLAYSARSSPYKGQPQVQLEWLEYRTNEPEKISLTTQKDKSIEHIDYRSTNDPQPLLKNLIEKFQPEIYGEGVESTSPFGKSRENLTPNKSLVIWSVPPSQMILEELVQKVHPARVFWFGITPVENGPDVLLKTAAQALKEEISQNRHEINLEQLAVKCATTIEVIELTIQWFAARGDIKIVSQDKKSIRVESVGTPSESQQKVIKNRLQKILAEIQAYRRYYLRSEPASLIDHP